MRKFNMYFIALAIAAGVVIDLPAFAQEQTSDGPSGEVTERGVPPPAYHCGQGICLCVGQANCAQLIEPTPCKRQKYCIGQTASPPPPLPPQEPALSKKAPPSTARTTTLNLLICSCRSGQ